MAEVRIPNPEPPRVPPPVIGHCPFCLHVATGLTHDEVYDAIVVHLRAAHGAKERES